MEMQSVIDNESAPYVLVLTAKIVSAHVSNNKVTLDGLPLLIQDVHHSLATADDPDIKPVMHIPAVPVKKSVFPDFIICLEDGKRLKMLKRHLRTLYNLTPISTEPSGACQTIIPWWPPITAVFVPVWQKILAWDERHLRKLLCQKCLLVAQEARADNVHL